MGNGDGEASDGGGIAGIRPIPSTVIGELVSVYT